MPFDEENNGGGGGHGPGHDGEGLMVAAKDALLMLSLFCGERNLCEYCAGLRMQWLMMEGMRNTLKSNVDSPADLEMAVDMARDLIKAYAGLKRELEEELEKYE